LALGFGTGLAPVAPGTAGTVPGVIVCVMLAAVPIGVYLAVTLLVALVGVWICDKASKELGVHDHGGIVWDEIAGFLITGIMVDDIVAGLFACLLLHGLLFFLPDVFPG